MTEARLAILVAAATSFIAATFALSVGDHLASALLFLAGVGCLWLERRDGPS